jgi:hypothetical protein
MAFFKTLNRANLCHRLPSQTAKPETRKARKAILRMMKEGKKFH